MSLSDWRTNQLVTEWFRCWSEILTIMLVSGSILAIREHFSLPFPGLNRKMFVTYYHQNGKIAFVIASEGTTISRRYSVVCVKMVGLIRAATEVLILLSRSREKPRYSKKDRFLKKLVGF